MTNVPALDRVNLQILQHLQRNARISISSLARSVNRAESTVRTRVATLEGRGIIQGYRTIIDGARLGFGAHVVLRASCDLSDVNRIRDQLDAIPQVVRVCLTTGDRPLLIELVGQDLGELQELVETKLGPLQLARPEQSVLMRHLIRREEVPVHVAFRRDYERFAAGLPEVSVRPRQVDRQPRENHSYDAPTQSTVSGPTRS